MEFISAISLSIIDVSRFSSSSRISAGVLCCLTIFLAEVIRIDFFLMIYLTAEVAELKYLPIASGQDSCRRIIIPTFLLRFLRVVAPS